MTFLFDFIIIAVSFRIDSLFCASFCLALVLFGFVLVVIPIRAKKCWAN